jgi:methionyl-tRNA formyltransferase
MRDLETLCVRPLRIIFAGSGQFGVPALRALLGSDHEIVQVVSQPDRPAGRGRALTPTPITAFAASSGLPLLKTSNINTEQLPPADLMLVIAFGQKIAPRVVLHPRLGSINLHASILPKYRGAAPINWAIIRGEKVTGNSVIRLAERMDAGAVLGVSPLEIAETETAGELHDRLAQDGAPLVLRVLDQLATGTATETPQDDAQATLAPKLSRESAKIDFSMPAIEIANQIRGMYPWPGCRVRLLDAGGIEVGKLTLVWCLAMPSDVRGEPGAIWSNGGIVVGDGLLAVGELQPEGKRPMSLAAFRNGHRWELGMKLEPV